MLITDRHSFYFSQFWSTSVQLGLLVYFSKFSPIRSIRSNSVLFDPFGLLWSFWSCSVHSVQFGSFSLLWSIQSTFIYSVHTVHLRLFSPIQSIRPTQVYLVQFAPFGPLQSIWSILDHFSKIRCSYLRMTRYKFGLRVLLII